MAQSITEKLFSPLIEAHKANVGPWLFVAKAMLSLYLTWWIVAALALPSPSMALLTVLVVMNAESGMIIAKSFFRIIGTAVGVIASITFAGLFGQHSELLILAMALWMGLCGAGAITMKGFRAYPFVLGGYTVAMILPPVINDPTAIYDVAFNRFAEVVIGLSVTTLVFDGLFPQKLGDTIQKMARENVLFLISSVGEGLADSKPVVAHHEMTRHSAGKAVGFEDMLANAVFEGPWLTRISRPLRVSNYYFIETLTRLQAFQQLMASVRHRFPDSFVRLDRLSVMLGERIKSHPEHAGSLAMLLRELESEVSEHRQQGRGTLSGESRRKFEAGVSLLMKVLKSMGIGLRAYEASKTPRHNTADVAPRPAVMRVFDSMTVLVTFVRTFVITLSVGILWLFSHWQAGATGVFIAVALSMMLAPLPNPVAAVRMAFIGHTTAPFIALMCFAILPSLTTYPLTVMGTAPFFMAMIYMITVPGWAGIAVPMTIGFVVALDIRTQVSLDYVNFFDQLLATIVGVTVAASAFLLFPHVTGGKAHYKRLLKSLDASVFLALNGPLPSLAQKIQTRNSDITAQVTAQFQQRPALLEAFLNRVLFINELCFVLLSLREARNHEALSDIQRNEVAGMLSEFQRGWMKGNLTAAAHQQLNARASLLEPVSRENCPLNENLALFTELLERIDDEKQAASTSGVRYAREF